ncbi:TrbI/VirB10 family protein (plasmid) [Nostoc sp. UHCC 0926]|uniref:TrbI/VirB10 family protein n=1 Tax=Nostoc sp. UHCC 0926 TaxID=3025190 RepID=UPI0023619DFA|nr:TrbI/VirB10 family protein [Nostoc sp. UHCC 0926]WDD36568.1 TrbI/VirB10 family protein [Nostoc sp. UHCC 0926]
MTNSNQNHEFEYLNENSADFSPEFNSTNGNHRSTQTTLVADDDISPEEEQLLAGYNPTASHLISEEYRLKQDTEGAVERPLAEKPSVRLGSVVGLVGMVIGSVALIWFGFLQPKPPVKQIVQTPTTSPKGEPVLDESAELKSRLAFQDQRQQLKVEPVAAKSPSPTLQNKPKPKPSQPQETFSPRTTPTSRITPITPVRISQPAPPVVRYISPNSVSYQASTPIRQPERNVDPFQQWSQLASLGQSQIGNSKVAETQSEVAVNTQTPTGLKSTARTSISTPEDPGIQTVLIGSKSTDSKTDNLTPGMVGILNRTPVATTNLNVNETKEVALGTSAPGRIIMPMIWDQGGNNPSDRFAIELTKPLTATDGTVALPAGTVFVTKTVAVGKKNNLVSASAIALIYPDSQGTVKQETIAAETFLIRGRGQQPLIAKKLNDVGTDIAQQDLLVGLLSSLGKVGSIVNQPRTQSSTVVSSGTFNQSTITTNSNPQIWAAALEGFFSPVSERLSRRSDQAVQELLQRPNIQFLPEGTEVSVVVNSFLKVEK